MQLQSEQKVIRQIPSKINVLHQFFKRGFSETARAISPQARDQITLV